MLSFVALMRVYFFADSQCTIANDKKCGIIFKVRQTMSVNYEVSWSKLNSILTDLTKEGEGGGFEEGSTAQTADCLRRVLHTMSFFR